jgi:hypothetical protein
MRASWWRQKNEKTTGRRQRNGGVMDILDKINRLLPESRIKSGGGSTTAYWELCDPKNSDEEGCIEVTVSIPWYYSPEEPDVGYRGGVEIDGVVTFEEAVTFMGKTYRAKQDFPENLKKYILDFAIDPPARMKSKYKGRDGWETFLLYQVEAQDRRF